MDLYLNNELYATFDGMDEIAAWLELFPSLYKNKKVSIFDKNNQMLCPIKKPA